MKNTLYHQLYEKLKKQIIEGQFKEGDKFYSKRQLSKHLSISQTTVEHAYQLLLDEGYIYSRPRSGYFVSEIESLTILNNQPIPSLLMMIHINQKRVMKLMIMLLIWMK